MTEDIVVPVPETDIVADVEEDEVMPSEDVEEDILEVVDEISTTDGVVFKADEGGRLYRA